MQNFSRIGQAAMSLNWRRLLIAFAAGLVVLFSMTACSQPDATANLSVPEATPAAVERAQSNLSEDSVDENALSRQSPSVARRSDGSTVNP